MSAAVVATVNQLDIAAREKLLLEHLPQVQFVARRIHGRLPQQVLLEDLVHAGILGLMDAVRKYDPTKNVKLKHYAEFRIRGAILDSLRGLDWAPRQKRRQAKRIEAAISTAEQRLKRAPDEQEIAEELEISLEEYHERLVEIRGLNIASLEYTTGEHGKDLLHYLPDADDNLPSKVLEKSELERLLAEGIDGIPKMERTVLGLYYQEELTLREIAQVVKLHESRISQLKSQAILRLRSHMAKQWPVSRGVVEV